MSAIGAINLAANGTSPPLSIMFTGTLSTQLDFLLGLMLTLSAGASLTATVQVTGDQTPNANGNWNNHDILFNQTASANSNIAYPVTGVRLVVTGWVSGSVNLAVTRWP